MLQIPIESKNYIENFLKDKDYIYITTITNEYVDMAYNWYLSLSRLGLENLCLIVCSDELTYNNLKKFDSKINCINLNIILPNNKNFFDWKEIQKKIKFTIPFYIAKNLKFPFFHSDVDIAFVGYAECEPRVRLVDASGTAEDVTARLVAQISDLLAEPA
jgi:hypothetical protein